MYLRRHRKKVAGEEYGYWSLVESIRTTRGPRQRIVATIGKLPDYEREEQIGWEEIGRILDGKPSLEPGLFEKSEEPPLWANVNLNRVSVERLRHFGDIYLALLLWSKLGFAAFCKERLLEGREEIPWAVMVCILVMARFCAPSSELQIADSWYDKTALDDLLGVPFDKINDDRLYRALDALLPHKDEFCRHLQARYGELFGTTFDFLFYDITSTYFEGNRVDVTTPKDMIQIMESKYGKANRIWVMDRGMVSEDNLDYMRQKGARYLVGTPKAMLKKFEQQLLSQDWEEVQSGVEVRLCPGPDDQAETFVLCRSQGRREKENAILNRFVQNMEAGLAKMEASMATGKLHDRQKVERRIGRLQERNSRAASLFTIMVTETGTEKKKKLEMTVHKNEDRCRQLLENGGYYLLRTNWTEADPKTIWNTYIQLTEVEDSFRTAKHDLGMRPVYHQKKERTHAHILVCFLSLAMWRTLQQWMKASGLGTAPRKLLEEMREIKSLDVLLPTRDKQIRLRVVSTAPKELKVLLQRMKVLLPSQPKIIENVVQKIA